LNLSHPAFEPYRELLDALHFARDLPPLAAFNRLAQRRGIRQSCGLPLRFVVPTGRLAARDYERSILQTGAVPTRADNIHDALNALVWLRFPHFKSALNAAHGAAIATEHTAERGRRRDALTVLDESGVWVASRDPALPTLLRAHAWQALFVEARARVERDMHFVVVGHALLEKTLDPYPEMTGKCLVLDPAACAGDVEACAVNTLAAIDTPRQLPPLPIQGIPGWDAANRAPAYYANPVVFRPARAPAS
jgi:hypothetical protein